MVGFSTDMDLAKILRRILNSIPKRYYVSTTGTAAASAASAPSAPHLDL